MEVDAGGVQAEWLSVGDEDAQRIVLYFHGGDYVMGGRQQRSIVSWRNGMPARRRPGCYCRTDRLAPENPFPAAVEDALTCWQWLLSQGHAPARMANAGDSAGGSLTLATQLALKGSDSALPACAVGLIAMDRSGSNRPQRRAGGSGRSHADAGRASHQRQGLRRCRDEQPTGVAAVWRSGWSPATALSGRQQGSAFIRQYPLRRQGSKCRC